MHRPGERERIAKKKPPLFLPQNKKRVREHRPEPNERFQVCSKGLVLVISTLTSTLLAAAADANSTHSKYMIYPYEYDYYESIYESF